MFYKASDNWAEKHKLSEQIREKIFRFSVLYAKLFIGLH